MKKVLITGSNGLVGQRLVHFLSQDRAFDVLATSKGINRLTQADNYGYYPLDITNKEDVARVMQIFQPEIVIHSAAMTQVDDCEVNKPLCWEVNVKATENLAQWSERLDAKFIYLSTDFVFDGQQTLYQETDVPHPISYYGKSKYTAEQILQKMNLDWAIVRTILVYGYAEAMQRSNIVSWVIQSLKEGKNIKVVNDQLRMPTFADDLARGIVMLLHKKGSGIYNMSGINQLSVYQFAQKVAQVWQLSTHLIEPTSSKTLNQIGKRPPSTGFILLKAQTELGYKPHEITEALHILKAQMAKK